MFQGSNNSDIQPVPRYFEEQPDLSLEADEGKLPLSEAVWNEAEQGATTGMSLLANLRLRAAHAENDLKQKVVGTLLSHPLTRNIGQMAAVFLSPPEKFMTSQEYEKSEYSRPGLNFPNGVHEDIAQLESWNYDKNQIAKDIDARTDQGTWPSIAKGAGSLAGGAVNPLFAMFGGIAGEAVAPAAKFLSDFIPELKFLTPEANMAIKNYVRSAGIGGAVMPVFTGIDYAEERANQEDASISQILYSVPIGMGFGLAGEYFVRKLDSRQPRLTSEFAEKEGLNEKTKGEPDPVVQKPTISDKNHEQMLTTSVSQMENGKMPEVSEIGKQIYHDDWQDNLGEKLRTDPEAYTKELEDLKTARDITQDKLDKINGKLDEFEQQNVALTDPRVSELMSDKDKILAKLSDIDDMIDSRETIPKPSDMEDVHSKSQKMRSQESDFSYYEPKEPVKIPEEEKTVNDFFEQEKSKFNERKANMDETTKGLADTEDIRTQNKGTRKFFNSIQACLRRGV